MSKVEDVYKATNVKEERVMRFLKGPGDLVYTIYEIMAGVGTDKRPPLQTVLYKLKAEKKIKEIKGKGGSACNFWGLPEKVDEMEKQLEEFDGNKKSN